MRSRLIVLTFLLVALCAGAAGSAAHRPVIAAASPTITVDAHNPSNATILATGPILDIGIDYDVTVVGTVSKWPIDWWTDNGVCAGTPNSSPMFPSPGVSNGFVGLDPDWIFGIPVGSSACPEGAPDDDGSFTISLDGGNSFADLDSTNKGSGPNAGHSYTYRVRGIGQAIAFAIKDVGDESYGQFHITIHEINQDPVDGVEFTQAIQQLQTLDQLDTSLATTGQPPVPIIAGKQAVMRIYFADVGAATTYHVALSGEISHSQDVTVNTGCTPDKRRKNLSGCLSLDYYFVPPSGSWSTRLQVTDTAGGPVLLDDTFNVTSVDTPALVIKYLPICVVIVGPASTCPSNAITGGDALLHKFYPVADSHLSYGPLPVPNLVYQSPITSDSAVVADLRQSYDLMTMGGFVADQLAGWLPPGSVTTGTLGISDPVWLGSTGNVTWEVDTSATDPLDHAFTLAHEIGHNLGLRHTNLSDGCNAKDPNTDWPYTDSTIQEVGFDVAAQKAIQATNFDLMTYCSPPSSRIWISPFTYNKLIASDFAPQGSSADAAPAGNTSQFLLVKGSAQADGSSASIDSAYVISSSQPADPSNPAGNYCLHFGGGTDYCFTMEFEDHRSHQPVPSESFEVRVPLPSGITRVALMHGGDELDALDQSPAAPALQIAEPGNGANWNGLETISWSASDTDGDALKFAVMYSPDDGSTWLPVDVDATSTSFSLDTSVLAGDHVLVRVLASDGLNTTNVTTGPVALTHPGPPMRGDASCDGRIDTVDVLDALSQVVGTQPGAPCGDRADVNCSGSLDADDALRILAFFSGAPLEQPSGCPGIGTPT